MFPFLGGGRRLYVNDALEWGRRRDKYTFFSGQILVVSPPGHASTWVHFCPCRYQFPHISVHREQWFKRFEEKYVMSRKSRTASLRRLQVRLGRVQLWDPHTPKERTDRTWENLKHQKVTRNCKTIKTIHIYILPQPWKYFLSIYRFLCVAHTVSASSIFFAPLHHDVSRLHKGREGEESGQERRGNQALQSPTVHNILLQFSIFHIEK